MFRIIFLLIFVCVCKCQNPNLNLNDPNRNRFGQDNSNSNRIDTVEDTSLSCPTNWVQNGQGCYKFVRSPRKNRDQARNQCKAYNANLVSVSNKKEHLFLTRYLHENDPLGRRWYTSGRQRTPGFWDNEADGTTFQDMMEAFIPEQPSTPHKNFVSYGYSQEYLEWGLIMEKGDEELQYICEVPLANIGLLMDEEEIRDHEYGFVVQDPTKVPRAPKIIKQPVDGIFDLVRRSVVNYVTLSCLADGYPYPEYNWYKESYEQDELKSNQINPLEDKRFTISGGTLIISDPQQGKDRGRYHCKARNKYGSVTSESVHISFAYVGEFNLKRSNEQGNQYWGKSIYCDPPQFFPNVRYYWSRNYFPNFVEEDQRTLVSHDGNLYFSYLDNIDKGSYSCSVQSMVSEIGKNGPFFNLEVYQHPNYQQLKFANNFPKAFPESPKRGEDVRLECIGFGYPVPSYEWTRKNGNLPRAAKLLSYNRVLILPNVEPADMGEYICRIVNDRLAIEKSISLSIQAKPNFTIPLRDQFISEGVNLIWECEAFGIPDVDYQWLRNSEVLKVENLPAEDQARFEIQDSVLKINGVKLQDQATYQCRASNEIGVSYSSAQLTILKLAPTFAKKPLDPQKYAAEGMNVTIECNPEAVPSPEFVWRKDNLVVGRGGRRQILSNGNLVISPVSREDGGNYTCEATNKYGSSKSSGELIVLRRPEFYRSPPKEIITPINETLNLECEAYTAEILDTTYIWRHNGLRIEIDNTNFLRRLAYEKGYEYDYYQRRKLSDGWHGDNYINYKQQENNYFRKREPPFEKGLREGHLRIVNVTLADAGVYECIAKTPVASISISTTLIIKGPPGPPGGISAVDLTSVRARIQWTDGATNGRPIHNYTIQGLTKWENKWKTLASNIVGKIIDEKNGRREYILENSLSPWSSYKFRIQAINELGAGQYSMPSPVVNSRRDVPFIAPRNIGGGGGKTGDLTIKWDPLPEVDQNAPGIYYKVFWKKANVSTETQFQRAVLRHRGNIGMHVVAVDPIKYFYSPYIVKVQAWNEMGSGPISNETIVYSAEDMPQVQPAEVSAFANNATSLKVHWKPIDPVRENIRGKLIGYRIKYWRDIDDEKEAIIRLQLGAISSANIVGLIPNTFYWVRVMAYNSAGAGPESERFKERTWRFPPLTPPNAVKVMAIDPSTIKVTWRGVTPTPKEEPLIGYKIKLWEDGEDFTKANNTIVEIGQHLEAYIYNLNPGVRYKLRVLAFSRGGDGKMSSPPWKFQLGDTDVLRGEAPAIKHLQDSSLLAFTFIVAFLTPVLRSRVFIGRQMKI